MPFWDESWCTQIQYLVNLVTIRDNGKNAFKNDSFFSTCSQTSLKSYHPDIPDTD